VVHKTRFLKFTLAAAGKEPFQDWLCSIRDASTRMRLRTRLDRVELGNYGTCEPVGEGVLELKFYFGSGYRIYLAEDNDTVVVLLCGGDKASQVNDIKKAKEYWQDYQERFK
jgi:putative addiction module killer protein